ncbi:hypothetical protein GUITHDRAFT_108789 [Guillardia theta CCMP2712]|uniref:Bromo domain-containing protein n=1 Tax=Guillardia theta (strain CCMP2712) TaxID=905079 RepID=L1J9D6_GUITC|nr:hypothetical protein GUITHDRAFT_108789 [Guillardia theta CCMP2712]EKX45141.1 hypothetical protein GUITHDRAFT_108789 [Guillardia theta CCMP2712]|eukprot:XP_005832121.1 hypothetical protein GUITHDRAFT_108789 [Guillardia theta CCMP2712]
MMVHAPQMSKPGWVKKCGNILKQLSAHPNSWVFNEPVDAEKLGLPDYHIVIKRPMDLGTVKSNLEKGVLANPQQFKDDVLLVFRNAMTYNPEGHDVHVMAKTLKVLFEGKWSQNEGIIMDAYNNAGSASESTKSKAGSEDSSLDNVPMTYEEKRELSASMNKLPGKRLASVVSFIHEKNSKILMQSGDDPDELEVDIDKLDNATLRQLERIANTKKKKRG